MEEVKKTAAPKKPTIKQLYLQAAGHEVGMDYFLYTCFEEEKTCTSLVGKHQKLLLIKRYPLLRSERQHEIAEDLDQALTDLFSWYLERYPQLKGSAVLDYMVHSELVSPFIYLLLDAKEVFRLKGQPLAAKLAPEVEAENDPTWGKLLGYFHKHCPTYYGFMAAYLVWTTKAAAPSSFDLKSVPPVGRYLNLLHDARRRAERKANQGSFSGGDSARPRYSGTRSSAPSVSRHGSSASSGSRPPSRVGEEGGRNNDYVRRVEQGIAKLKRNILLKEVVLAPENSFVRREQHKLVKELGFASESSGEGDQRAVKIIRLKKAKKK